jgi:hypothetical protein
MDLVVGARDRTVRLAAYGSAIIARFLATNHRGDLHPSGIDRLGNVDFIL